MSIPILSSSDLQELGIINNLHIKYVVDMHDLHMFKCTNNSNYIININSADPNQPMGHWVALCVRNNVAAYFDPYGVPPSTQIEHFAQKGKFRIVYSSNDIQPMDDSPGSISCGFFCLSYIHYINNTRGNIEDRIKSFCNLFFNDTRENLKVLQQYIRQHFRY